jgi:hypothetical protein
LISSTASKVPWNWVLSITDINPVRENSTPNFQGAEVF